MSLPFKTRWMALLALSAASIIAGPQAACAASRTFLSLAVTPPSTNVTAGATITAIAALTTKASSGNTASGQVTNTVSISPQVPDMTVSINPALYVIGASQTSNSILTVTTTPSTPANTYVVRVVASAGPSNPNLATITPITNTFSVTVASGASDSFSMSMSPASTNVAAGIDTNVIVAVTFTDNSSTISGTVTNGVIVTGPDTVHVTGSLDSSFANISPDFGQTNLMVTIHATADATPGVYRVIVTGTNSTFIANSPIPGIASATNTFILTGPSSFKMDVSPMSETVPGGMATNVTATVSFTNDSQVVSGTVTNTVKVSPAGQGVTANLNTGLAFIDPGGQAALVLTVSATANAIPGIYEVIVSGTNGAFTANSPVSGTASITNRLTVKPAPSPSIQSFSLSGANLVIVGTNGIPARQYAVLASTNLILPLAQWTPVVTNIADGNGDFTLTNLLSPGNPQQFFTLSLIAQSMAASPIFNPAAAAYPSEQAVVMTTPTGGATIRYTTDGSTPTSSHGTLYTGPVAILGPVVTNLTGTFSNASGVTMLKAVAFKTGMSDSPVFTGNYQIMVPAPEVSSSPLRGIAHLAYRVTSLTAARHFWKDYLGFAEPFLLPNSNAVAIIKINDQQYVELYQGPIVPPQYQVVNYGYQVSDAEAHRQQLAAAGASVPASVSTNALGNISFFSADPDGHQIEWVEYVNSSLTGQTQGQAMPGTQVFGYIISTGGFTANDYVVNNAFYITQCGFLPNGSSGINSHLINIPNSDAFYEHGSYNTLDAPTAGKKSQVDLLNFRGMTIQQSVDILTSRDPSIEIDLHLTNKGRYVGNVYDPDGTRVELDDQ